MAEKKTETLYGAHAIIEALKAKKRSLISIYTTNPTPKSFERVQKYLPKNRNIPVNKVSRDSLARICQSNEHMGIVAWVSEFPYQKNFFSPAKNPKILILDSIQDPRNLGAILRSAHCTNFDGVVICSSKSTMVTPAAVKASAGLSEHLSIFLAKSSQQAITLAKQAGYNLYLAVLENGEDISKVEIKIPICIVIGNEEKGISSDLLENGKRITIPQKNQQVSYNASVAAGIIMFYTSFLS